MNLAIALTAARYGAATANYAEVLRLLKTTDPAGGKERVCGVRCRDVLTGACLPRGAEGRGDPKAASCPPSPTDRASDRAVRHRAPFGLQHPARWVEATACRRGLYLVCRA